MKKKRQLPVALKVLVLTFVTVVIWVTFEVYRSLTVKPTTEVPESVLEPLDPNLDTNTLNNLRGRIYLDDVQNIEVNLQTSNNNNEGS